MRSGLLLILAFLPLLMYADHQHWVLDLGAPTKVSTSFASEGLAADAVRQHWCAAGAARLPALSLGDTIAFRLFDDFTAVVELVREMPARKGRAFMGRVPNEGMLLNAVVLETAAGILLDLDDFAHQRVWQVVPGPQGVFVSEKKVARQADCACCAHPDEAASPLLFSAPLKASLAGSALSASEPRIVDVLVAYDRKAFRWVTEKGEDLETFAEKNIQRANAALVNSALDQKFLFRLAGIYVVEDEAEPNLQATLLRINSGDASDPMTALKRVRKELCADLVSLLIDTGSAAGGVGSGLPLTLKNLDSAVDQAYSVCAVRAADTELVMAHEMGHNLGAGHADQSQSYSYSRGYYFVAEAQRYHTVMAYNYDGQHFYTPAPIYSSPNQSYQGTVVGDANHNNASVLGIFGPVAARYLRRPEETFEMGYAAALDCPDYAWWKDGAYAWTVIAEDVAGHAGTLKSEILDTYTATRLRTYVEGPATLSFEYAADVDYGVVKVLCDESPLFSADLAYDDGEVTWKRVTNLIVPEGLHEVVFSCYSKLPRMYSGVNALWLDQVRIQGGAPVGLTKYVFFEPEGGACAESSRRVRLQHGVGALPVATREGYALRGWYTKPSGGEKIEPTTSVDELCVCYAQWTKAGDESWPTVNGERVDPLEVFAHAHGGQQIVYPTEPEIITAADGRRYVRTGEIQTLIPPYYRVEKEGCVLTLAFDEQQALPKFVEGGDRPGFEVGATSVTFRLTQVVPGFFYGVFAASTLEGLEQASPQAWARATDAKLLEVSLPRSATATQGFYRFAVSDVERK